MSTTSSSHDVFNCFAVLQLPLLVLLIHIFVVFIIISYYLFHFSLVVFLLGYYLFHFMKRYGERSC